MQQHLIFPIALDLGAKTTGVYATCYPAGSHIEELNNDKHFKVGLVAKTPEVKDKGYKVLQTSRTEKRHARRCRTRNSQAKRLLMLILESVYQFPADRHREAINHFMNRRGFTYLESQVNGNELDVIDPEYLADFAQRLYEEGLYKVPQLISTSQPLKHIVLFDGEFGNSVPQLISTSQPLKPQA